MELVVQLVMAIAVFGVTLSGGSLLWPRITSAPMPQILQEVRSSVIKTQPGNAAAQVLGVTDDKTVKPINLGEVANSAWNGIKSAAQKRATTIVMSQVTQQLTNQYDKLPKDQQKTLQQIICKTATSSASR
jgi:hypothetical protein